MLGIPGQNVLTLIRQAFFVLKLKIFFGERLKIISFNKLGIDPNTDLEKMALKEGIITDKTDLFNPTFYQVGIVEWIGKLKGLRTVLKIVKNKIAH
jgi:hypothetical protein